MTNQPDDIRIGAALDLINDDFYKVIEAESGLRHAESELRASVLAGRETGLTWETIGEVLGISKQAAYQRFSK